MICLGPARVRVARKICFYFLFTEKEKERSLVRWSLLDDGSVLLQPITTIPPPSTMNQTLASLSKTQNIIDLVQVDQAAEYERWKSQRGRRAQTVCCKHVEVAGNKKLRPKYVVQVWSFRDVENNLSLCRCFGLKE